jgi:Prealbumin-like fold domain
MKKKQLLAGLAALAVLLALAIPAIAGPVGTASGFEDDDGNLAPAAPINFDWNSFAPTTWTGTAPNRIAAKVVNGWDFDGIEDAQVTTSDNAFAGGTKQDDECASVITAKAPNKDDLKRVYFSTKTVSGQVFLNLAWVRIPQNTTSPSAHIAFEFNQSETPCGGPGGLVERSTTNGGDVLIVYDFEGGSTDNPTITLSRWVGAGACEVGSNSPPCWGPADTLGVGEAEARVNTSTVGPVQDTIQPPPAQNPLGLNEFGEAGINLTAAGVFPAGECRAFGNAFAVSRTSGSSSTAQMKDLVGPGNVDITNCGIINIIKRTDPRGVDQDFGYTSNIAGTQLACTTDTTPAIFTLNDAAGVDNTVNTERCVNVPAGNYTVTEDADPAGFDFADLSCTATGTGTSATPASGNATRTASITIAGGGEVTCVYTNRQELGAIKITKTRKHAATPDNDAHAGVNFTVGGTPVTTDANGEACVDGLLFGSYDVVETVPAGYVGEGGSTTTVTKSVTVDNNATCEDNPYGGESVSFHNTPLTDLTVTINSQVDGGTASTVDCVEDEPAPADVVLDYDTGANGDGTETATNLLPQTIICTIVIDP